MTDRCDRHSGINNPDNATSCLRMKDQLKKHVVSERKIHIGAEIEFQIYDHVEAQDVGP